MQTFEVIMSERELQRIVGEFADSVMGQGEAIQRDDTDEGNALAKKYIQAAETLLSLGNDGVHAFSSLLNDDRVPVRTMAASYLLPYKTGEALRVLEESARGRGITAFGAFMALARWKGREKDLSALLKEYGRRD